LLQLDMYKQDRQRRVSYDIEINIDFTLFKGLSYNRIQFNRTFDLYKLMSKVK